METCACILHTWHKPNLFKQAGIAVKAQFFVRLLSHLRAVEESWRESRQQRSSDDGTDHWERRRHVCGGWAKPTAPEEDALPACSGLESGRQVFRAQRCSRGRWGGAWCALYIPSHCQTTSALWSSFATKFVWPLQPPPLYPTNYTFYHNTALPAQMGGWR